MSGIENYSYKSCETLLTLLIQFDIWTYRGADGNEERRRREEKREEENKVVPATE